MVIELGAGISRDVDGVPLAFWLANTVPGLQLSDGSYFKVPSQLHLGDVFGTVLGVALTETTSGTSAFLRWE